MMRFAPVLALTALIGTAAAENAAIAISGGFAYRYEDDARHATQEGEFSWNKDYGYHVRLGSAAPEGGGSLDIDWVRNTGNGNRLDTVGVLYIQRIPIGPVRLGLGLGSFYSDIRLSDRSETDWTIGGTASLGMDLVGPLFIEGGYNLTSLFGEKTAGLKTDYVFLDLGIRF